MSRLIDLLRMFDLIVQISRHLLDLLRVLGIF